MKKTLLIMMTILPECRQTLQAEAPQWEIVYCEGKAPTDEDLARASFIWGNPPVARLALCRRLEWLQLQTAGFEAYTVPGALPKGVVLTNSSGAYGLTISEYLISTTLSLMKKLPLYRDAQHAHRWKNLGRIRLVAHVNVLVVGVGDIGGQYAQKMHALGARVSGVRRKDGEKPDYLEALYRLDMLDEILPRFDVVALCLPNNAQTAGLFTRERIARMKPGALLLNVGRGNAVDTDALCDALQSGALGGAGLDVVDPEPLPPGHRLWDIPTALLTPHASGGDAIGDIYPSILAIWRENLRRWQAKEPLQNEIDLRTGYRE